MADANLSPLSATEAHALRNVIGNFRDLLSIVDDPGIVLARGHVHREAWAIPCAISLAHPHDFSQVGWADEAETATVTSRERKSIMLFPHTARKTACPLSRSRTCASRARARASRNPGAALLILV